MPEAIELDRLFRSEEVPERAGHRMVHETDSSQPKGKRSQVSLERGLSGL